MPSAFLSNRTFIRVTGEGAQDFLQNLITTDLETLAPGEARPGALLTPQGKILSDFLISQVPDGYRLETDRAQQDGLLRRLTLYKLRAPVALAAEEIEGVSLFWNEEAPADGVRDCRFAKAGISLYRMAGHTAAGDASAYHMLRIDHGIASSGIDYALSDAFPHDVLMDVNDGVSFKKGCFVGQEVVSRMKHRGTARRRVVTVSGESALPASGAEIMAGGKPIGVLGTVIGNRALSIIRIDRAADAMASGTEITAGDVAVTVTLPAWSGLDFPAADSAASAGD